MVILVRIPGQQAKQAAESLAREARNRVIEPVTIAATPAAALTAEEAARLCKDNAAQLMATIQYMTSGPPPSATIEFRDTAGQIAGTTVSCRPEQRWYSWQLLLLDAIAASLLLATGGRTSFVPATAFTRDLQLMGMGRAGRLRPEARCLAARIFHHNFTTRVRRVAAEHAHATV